PGGMDGLELAERARSIDRSIGVIVVTGYASVGTAIEAIRRGIDDYVTKPFNPRVLLARVRAGERVVRLQNRVSRDKQTLKKQMTKLAVLNRRLERASVTDPLTELKNRRYAMERLVASWAKAKRSGVPFSVIMIDIDHFKQVNDRHGHATGDEVLRSTADVLRREVRTEECVCRLGGEEFLVILPEASVDAAAICAERIRRGVETNRVSTGEFEDNVTISLGVASSDGGFCSFESLLNAADAAVYEAKRQGRNRVCLSSNDVPLPA
ncbi:MAG: diguanylate cyclase, partial [Planctomycetes bacterium]|nr:diguanylate cyclase [Planctomycetota bacterium]